MAFDMTAVHRLVIPHGRVKTHVSHSSGLSHMGARAAWMRGREAPAAKPLMSISGEAELLPGRVATSRREPGGSHQCLPPLLASAGQAA